MIKSKLTAFKKIQTLAFKFHPKKGLFILDQTLLPEKKEMA